MQRIVKVAGKYTLQSGAPLRHDQKHTHTPPPTPCGRRQPQRQSVTGNSSPPRHLSFPAARRTATMTPADADVQGGVAIFPAAYRKAWIPFSRHALSRIVTSALSPPRGIRPEPMHTNPDSAQRSPGEYFLSASAAVARPPEQAARDQLPLLLVVVPAYNEGATLPPANLEQP